MMLGLTDITAGEARVLGHDPVREPLQVKRLVGYLPDTVGFYDHMTAADNLRYTARLIGIPPNASARTGSPRRSTASALPMSPTSTSAPSRAACASGSGLPRS